MMSDGDGQVGHGSEEVHLGEGKALWTGKFS